MRFAQKILPCLWYDNDAEAAARFYTSVFPDSRILEITHYGEAGHEVHGRPAGSVLTVTFTLNGQTFTALNGGPQFKFNEAVSFQILCDSQAEVDHYWNALSAGGDERAQQCGWLSDRYGLAWQVVPQVLIDLITDKNAQRSHKAMTAMLRMKKIDIAALERACAT